MSVFDKFISFSFPLIYSLALHSDAQDGKALPDGPVVISPDGLFPSLYREGENCPFKCFSWLYLQ